MFLYGKDRKRSTTFDAFMETETVISPSEYLDIINNDSKEIVRSSIVPPRLGDKNLGQFRVEWSRPRYKILTDTD